MASGVQGMGPNAISQSMVGAGTAGPGASVPSQSGLAQQIAARNQAVSRQSAEVDPRTLADQLGQQAMSSVKPVSVLDVVT